jgi:hypothetical protein
LLVRASLRLAVKVEDRARGDTWLRKAALAHMSIGYL